MSTYEKIPTEHTCKRQEYITPAGKQVYNSLDMNNSLMNRSLQSMSFVNRQEENIGISTRNVRKVDNFDTHLSRSMLQPDFRQGNRFFEMKPENTRRENYRGIDNENVRKFQNQSQEFYKNELRYKENK